MDSDTNKRATGRGAGRPVRFEPVTVTGYYGRSVGRILLATAGALIWLATDLAPVGVASPAAKHMAALIPAVQGQRQASTMAPFSHDQHALVAPSRDETMRRVEVASKLLGVANEEFVRLEADLNRVEVSADELRAETAVVAEETLTNAIQGYRHGVLPQTLLTTDDLTASLRSSALGGAAISSDTQAFERYRAIRKDLEIEETELAGHRQQVDQAQAEIAVLEDELTEELLRFGELEERRLQAQAAAVAAQASNRAQSRGRKQGFYLDTCPVNGPHEFIDSWGFARSGGRRHKGVDMLAPRGTELVAPISGVVEHYSNTLGGRSFRLFDENGNYFYGTHMSGFGKSGEVRAGEVIGYVGDDGNAAGINHLHFELHPGGRGNPINPFLDTAAVCSGAQS